MTLIGSTLTLPGIAGFVLTIGMAVDANVLIYERIREELRAGKTPIAAIEPGFQRAFVTIFDSQLTTLACAVIMFWLGSGPIRGFAVTLTIGILTSVFAAVTVTRLLVVWWLKAQKAQGPHRRSAGLERQRSCCHEVLPTSRASTSSRTTCGCPSCATRALALGAVDRLHGGLARPVVSTRGLNYGVDFKGGSLIEVQIEERPCRHLRAARQAQRARRRQRADPELRPPIPTC